MLEDSLSEEERLALREQVERLREEHRDLDAAIDALADAGQADRLQIQRLKKLKLVLRDRLKALEDLLTPDIVA
ncbi:MAG: YdcH family protein [Roseiarcus sp.]